MIGAALRDGTAVRDCVFEVFARRLPLGRRYGVVAGTGRLLDLLNDFHFDGDEIDFLINSKVINEETARWLESFKFKGSIWGYPEGELYFPNSPIFTVQGSFAECVVLETLILSVLNHDSAI